MTQGHRGSNPANIKEYKGDTEPMNHKSSLKALTITCFTFFLLLNREAQAAGLSQSPTNRQELPAIVQSGEPCKARPLVLTEGQNQYLLGRHIDLLKDPDGTLTIDQVSSPEFNEQFTPSQVDIPTYGYTNDVYWVRLCLDNETRQTGQWLLDTGFPNMHYVDLYTPRPDGTGFASKQTGVMRPVSTRDLLLPHFVFDLNVPARTQETLYLRFQSGASMTLPLTIWQPGAFFQTYASELLLLGLFYGALFIMLVYRLIRRYHTLNCEGEKRGVSFRICITRLRKEPLHEPLCQNFPRRKTVSCIDGIHTGRISGAVARLSQLLSEADGALHAEREEAWETMLCGILQQSFADD